MTKWQARLAKLLRAGIWIDTFFSIAYSAMLLAQLLFNSQAAEAVHWQSPRPYAAAVNELLAMCTASVLAVLVASTVEQCYRELEKHFPDP